MIVSMLQNWSHKYFSHHSIIKFVCFEPIYYVINLGVVSFSMIDSTSRSSPVFKTLIITISGAFFSFFFFVFYGVFYISFYILKKEVKTLFSF